MKHQKPKDKEASVVIQSRSGFEAKVPKQTQLGVHPSPRRIKLDQIWNQPTEEFNLTPTRSVIS